MQALHILAHQGGWDEIALVGGPIMVFAGLLAVARRRALEHAERRQDESPSDER